MMKRFKRIVSMLLTFGIIVTLIPVASIAATTSDFVIQDGVLTDYTGAGGEVIIPDSITAIGDAAFLDCSNITKVSIGPNVTSIGRSAFKGCSGLTAFEVSSSNSALSSQDGILFSKDMTKLYYYPANKDGDSYSIPNSVTAIGHYAFLNCTKLTTIDVPSSVASIGDSAFYGTSWVQGLGDFAVVNDILVEYQGSEANVVIPNNIVEIGAGAFGTYFPLTNIVIPDSVTTIGYSAFSHCHSLKTLVIPNSVEYIGESAFHNAGLTTLKLGQGLKEIGNRAFNTCQHLTEVTIPNGVKTIGDETFVNCEGLTSMTIPASVTHIGIGAFDECPNLTIKTSSGSYAEAYAKENGIPYTNIAADTPPQVTDISDLTLFTRYPQYLRNSLYTITHQDTMEYISRVLDEYSGANNFFAAFKLCLDQGGLSVMLNELVSFLSNTSNVGIADSVTHDIATELVLKAGRPDIGYAEDICSQTSDALAEIKGIVDFADISSKVHLADIYHQLILETFDNLTETEIIAAKDVASELADEMVGDTGENISNLLKIADIGMNTFEMAALTLSLYATEIKVYDNLIACFPADSPIRDELIVLKKQTEDIGIRDFVVLSLLDEHYIDLIQSVVEDIVKDIDGVSSLAELLGTSDFTLFVAECALKVAGSLISGGTSDEIVKLAQLYTAITDIDRTLIQIQIKAFEGTITEEDIEIYEMAFSTKLMIEQLALEAAKELTKDKTLKYTIEKWLTLLSQRSYEHYIELCKDAVIQNQKLSYTIEDEEVTILGMQPETGEAQPVSRMNTPETVTLLSTNADIPSVLYIPEEIDGYPVTSIGEGAFANDDVFDLIIFESNLNVIGESAFSNCANLETITFLNPVAEIRPGAFSNCNKIVSVSIPFGTESIGANVFSNCSSLEEVSLSSTVKTVGEHSFSGASNDLVLKGVEQSLAQEIAQSLGTSYDMQDPNVLSVSIESLPTRTSYRVGDTFEPEGLKLSATYDDGTTREVTAGYSVVFDSDVVGEQDVVILYENTYTSFKVTVAEAEKTYRITFNPSSGFVSPTSAQTEQNGKLSALPVPELDGYVFIGWFSSAEGGTKITPDTVFTEDVVVFAQWEKEKEELPPTSAPGGNGESSGSSGAGSAGGSSAGGNPSGSSTSLSAEPLVSLPQDGCGNILISPETPIPGDTVTLTVIPDGGYAVNTLTVTDDGGDPVEVTDNGDNTYSFKQPIGRVTVSVTYKCGGTGDCPSLTYSDLDVTTWYHVATDYVIENSLMNGTGGGKFEPAGATDRVMIATILWRLENSPAVDCHLTFEDVTTDAWYTGAVCWIVSAGIAGGYNDTSFGPTDVLTREQFATILYRYAKYKGLDVHDIESTDPLPFEDVSDISGWAYPAMVWAYGEGIITGRGNGILDPQGNVLRVEAAQILMNFLKQ